jgi:acetyltransferase-like isoleucine patch superfamily enzyme
MFWRALFNRWRRALARVLLHRMVFGERSDGQDRPFTRISPSTCIEHEDRLHLADHVYIGPFNLIEASGGITLGEGVQVTSHCSIITHSSHRSMRLLGRAYAQTQKARPGWIEGPVVIGAYSFIGPHSLIEAGTQLGRGTLVCAGSVVRGEFPDFAVLQGNPAQVVGDTRRTDEALLARHPETRAHYDAWAGGLEAAEPTATPQATPPSA